MKIDEDLIKKKFEKLIKSNYLLFFQKGERRSNVQCKKIALIDLRPINEVDGRTQFSVSGRGDFFESFGDFGKETNMDFEAAILVHGDDILNEAEIRVNISLT